MSEHEKPHVRRSLTHVGGEVKRGGDKEASPKLARALDVASSTASQESEDAARAHVHGFHAYPARMHPGTAASLVRDFAAPRARVLDPFCGSGTVLVEACIAGREALGSDVNPIAVHLARLKTRLPERGELEHMHEVALDVAAGANARRKARAGATRRYPDEDMRLFAPHVLLELDGVRAGIEAIEDSRTRAALFLVLSSLLVKLSKKTSDTSPRGGPREGAPAQRIAAGYPTKLFVKKTEELARRREAFAALVPRPAPRVRIVEEDATRLESIAPGSIDLVITSPPYAATYDYLEHHEMRLRWLGLGSGRLEKDELGARRRYRGLDEREARHTWIEELRRMLLAMGRVLRPGGSAILLVGDSALRGPRGAASYALRADELVAEAAEDTPLVPHARATQARPHFHEPSQDAFRERPRAEHLLLLVRS